jgi:4-hydroxy-2-oxoheptanedioate aldolase
VPYHAKRGFRESVLGGELKLGVVMLASSPVLIEVAGYLGYDFVLIDLEHGDGIDSASVAHLIRAADAAGVTSMVRVARNEPDHIMRVLDAGAAGVVVPHIQTAEDAKRAVASTKYPPGGDRGICQHIRAAEYGGYGDWSGYWPVSDAETVVGVLVEDVVGLEHLDEIAGVTGVDIVWLGFGDLSQSMGLGRNDPAVAQAGHRAVEAARRHGKVPYCSLPAGSWRSDFATWFDAGVRMFSWTDINVFSNALRAFAAEARHTDGGRTDNLGITS